MSNYYEYEEYSSRRRRDLSPDNYSGGAPAPNNSHNPGGAQGQGPPPPPPPPPPGAPPYASTSRLDEQYGAAPPRDRMTLEPPPSQARPRSVPPPNTIMVRRSRSRSRPASVTSSQEDDDDDRRSRGRQRSQSPISRARGAVEDNFSNSAAGIGAGLLGAVVGGLVAREASDAATRHKHKTRGYDDENENRTRLVSTILGVVAGGLGANAIANRVEDSRDRDRRRQLDWERDRGYVREEEMPRYDRRRSGDRDRGSRSRDRYDRGRALPANDDDEYDFVYDDPRYDDRQPQRRRSEDAPRYRQ